MKSTPIFLSIIIPYNINVKTLHLMIIAILAVILVIGGNAAFATTNGSSSVIFGNATFHVSHLFHNVAYANANPFSFIQLEDTPLETR